MFSWFTFDRDEDVCFIADLNREKRISQLNRVNGLTVDIQLALGTALYGTIVLEGDTQFFIIEDIYFYKGVAVKNVAFIEKLDIIQSVIQLVRSQNPNPSLHFVLPVISVCESSPENIGYAVHHLQYRSADKIMPYLNEFTNKKTMAPVPSTVEPKVSAHRFQTMSFKMDTFKPQYKYPTVFQVTADIQYDIYHLFAFGKNNIPVYFDVAYIPNCKNSAFMNSQFRSIRENKNLDYIEESDDEDDFQNIEEDKYVDVNKVLSMECLYHAKFRRWVPVRVMDKYCKIVHISKLIC